ncbi:MAG: hypothetical protein WCX65_15650 [bacterium]
MNEKEMDYELGEEMEYELWKAGHLDDSNLLDAGDVYALEHDDEQCSPAPIDENGHFKVGFDED